MRWRFPSELVAKLTIISAYCFVAFYNATDEAISPHAAENNIRLDALRKLTLGLMDHARMPLPQKRMIV